MSGPIYTTNHNYTVVPYSPEWPIWYKKEATLLSEIFADQALSIQHVGSTSIPGMTSKPQLDILVLVEDVAVADALSDRLITEGYTSHGNILNKGGRLFSRWEGNGKTVNLHVYPPESQMVWQFVATRDYLIAHPDEAKAYAELKLELHKRYPHDYLKYREHKDPWLDALHERMKRES